MPRRLLALLGLPVLLVPFVALHAPGLLAAPPAPAPPPEAPASQALPASEAPAADLLAIPAERWDLEEGIALRRTDAGLELSLKGKPYASAATRRRFTLSDQASVTLAIRSRRGDFSAQIEWFDDAGQFLDATPLLEPAQADAGLNQRRVLDLLPTRHQAAARRFRIKLWLGGPQPSTTLVAFAIHAPARWLTPGFGTLHTYSADSATHPDAGLVLEKDAGLLVARTAPGTPFSAFTFTDRVRHHPNGAAMIEIEELAGGSLTVQALCWDAGGQYLKAIDLLKDVLEPGVFEAGFELYADQFPSQTAGVSFKVWVGGAQPVARIQSLMVGRPGEQK